MASQGPNSPGTAANDSSYGGANWNNPDNCKTANSIYASYSSNEATTYYLKATNFGFSIPTGATIDGIVAEVKRYCSAGFGYDSSVKIVKSNGSIGTTEKSAGEEWSSVNQYKTFGSNSDKWGETWTKDDINDTDFGVAMSAYVVGGKIGAGTIYIDHIRITVYYTEGGSSSAIKTVNGLAKASVKTVDGLAIASVKNINGLT